MQNFKGDALELKMQSVANPLLDNTTSSLDDFYNGVFESNFFLLMLYDDKRMPFAQRISRDAYIQFINAALTNFPFIGSFESYLFILRSIFGAESDITFDAPSPGMLDISISSYTENIFNLTAREPVGATLQQNTLVTTDGDEIVVRGIPGILNEYEMNLLFSEIIPAGIYYTFSLNFLSKSFWITSDSDNMVDSFGNDLIFIELGG